MVVLRYSRRHSALIVWILYSISSSINTCQGFLPIGRSLNEVSSGSCSIANRILPPRLHYHQVASELLDDEERTPPKTRLTRPQRKALERERKQQNKNSKTSKRKHNYSDRRDFLKDKRRPGEGRYDLHNGSVLNETSTTPDEIMRAIKRAQNLHDAHDLLAIERFLLERTDPHFAYGYRGSLLARLAVAALHLGNHRLARVAIHERCNCHSDSRQPHEAAALIRGLLRQHNVSDAWAILNDELHDNGINDIDGGKFNEETRVRLSFRAQSLCSIISRHFFEGEPVRAVAACGVLRDSPVIQGDLPWTRLIRGAALCQTNIRNNTLPETPQNKQYWAGQVSLPCNVVYSVLGAMAKYDIPNDHRLYEWISNALLRRVVFVTGAVNMDGLPNADRGEACFIGRSNVGKSSLINMLTNRKSLAFTSKRPGKTQQFNYFAVNDAPGLEKFVRYGDPVTGAKDADSFYLVDVPGFGYARVPDKVKAQWRSFLREYLTERPTLRVVFHLIDSRHGPTPEDEEIMGLVGEIKNPWKYAIVLTKVDKNARSKETKPKVKQSVMDSVQGALDKYFDKPPPVLLTSAEHKWGRDSLWRYLSRAAE